MGIAACDDMVEHLVEALKQKLEVPLAAAVETVVARATEQLKTNVGRVFDQTQQEAKAEVARLKEVEAELHRRAGARTQDALLLDDCVCQLCTGKVACVICSSSGTEGERGEGRRRGEREKRKGGKREAKKRGDLGRFFPS